MVFVVDELKKKQADIGLWINQLRAQISVLEQQRPITTADFAKAFARENGLGEDDARPGLIGNRFSQMLDQLAKSDQVRRAGKVDGQRHLWEVAV